MCVLGASVGASIFPKDGETCDSLLSAADRAMYHVKHHGKLGVMFAGSGQSRERQGGERPKTAD